MCALGPGGAARLPDRPSPAGNEATVSPSPLVPVQRADPRSTMEALPPGGGPERTDGRTATRREHGPRRRAHANFPYAQQSRHTEHRPLTVGMRRTTLGLRMPRAYAGRHGGRLGVEGWRMSRELRGPNEKLGTVLALAGISNAGLARRVNDLGAQRGLTLRYDKTSVARWVSKGMIPQGAAPHLIAAAIGQKLGRPVPLHEIGLADADPAPEVGLAFPRDVGEAVKAATELYRLDFAGRRGGGGIWQSLAGSFAVSAYATPASRWLITPADPSVERPAPRPEGASGARRVQRAHRPGPCRATPPAARRTEPPGALRATPPAARRAEPRGARQVVRRAVHQGVRRAARQAAGPPGRTPRRRAARTAHPAPPGPGSGPALSGAAPRPPPRPRPPRRPPLSADLPAAFPARRDRPAGGSATTPAGGLPPAASGPPARRAGRAAAGPSPQAGVPAAGPAPAQSVTAPSAPAPSAPAPSVTAPPVTAPPGAPPPRIPWPGRRVPRCFPPPCFPPPTVPPGRWSRPTNPPTAATRA